MPLTADDQPLDPENNVDDQAFLETIQGNILNPHGRNLVRLVLFQFTRTDASLRDFFPAAVAAGLVTSAKTQWEQARTVVAADRAMGRPGFNGNTDHDDAGLPGTQPFFSLGISLLGLERCGLADPLPGGNSTAFKRTMKADSEGLGDPQVKGEPVWDQKFLEQPHGVWLLANDDAAELDKMVQQLDAFLARWPVKKLAPDDVGLRWRDAANPQTLVREPFGFIDGISQPEFFETDEYHRMSKWVKIPRSQILLRRGPHQGGSFLVVRKLQQDVQGFRKFEQSVRDDPAWPRPSPYDPGAVLIGRERDGRPLQDPLAPGQNDFSFDGETARCPFHAHIRKVNPRINGGPDKLISKTEENMHRAQVMVRRSAVYDKQGLLPALATGDYPEGDHIDSQSDVGLLFMAYMSDLEQFITLQKNWFANADFPPPAHGTLADPIVRPVDLPGMWSWLGVTKPLQQCVHPRGGAYFYVPSMTWLAQPKL